MVNKRKLHHILVVISRVKLWQLLIILALLLLASAYLLRQNSLKMDEYRTAVEMADETGYSLESSLTNLQQYVNSHMNTNLGNGVFLEKTYQRDYDAALKAAASVVNPSSAVYIQSERECRDQYGNVAFQLYLECIQERISALAPGSDPLQNVKVPPAELYHYNFSSPKFSFDAAGIVVLITILLGLVILLRITTYSALKIVLAKHK